MQSNSNDDEATQETTHEDTTTTANDLTTTSEPEGHEIPLSTTSRQRSATAIGMGLVGGVAPLPTPIGITSSSPTTSQSKLEIMSASYSRGSSDEGERHSGIRNYPMKSTPFRYQKRGSAKTMPTGPMRKAGDRGVGGRGGRGGRGSGAVAVAKSTPSKVSKSDSTILQNSASLIREVQPITNLVPDKCIEGCSNIFVVATFIWTLVFPLSAAIPTLYQHSEMERKILDRVPFLASPISYGALCTSVFLQPRNNKPTYKVVLFSQAFLLLVYPDISRLAYYDSSLRGFGVSFERVSVGLYLFKLLLHVRSRAAKLSRKRLSRFLTDHLILPALTFFGMALFFALDPLRCFTEHHDSIAVCDKTLIGQASLFFILLVFVVFTHMHAVFPKRVGDNHTVSFRQIATGDLTFKERMKLVVEG